MKKRIIAVLCIFVMCISMVLPVSAEEGTQTGYYFNPFYESKQLKGMIESVTIQRDELPKTSYLTNTTELANALRNAMVQRQTSVTLYYKAKTLFDQSTLDQSLDIVFQETSKSNEGDYLLGHFVEVECDGEYYDQSGYYWQTLYFNFIYCTTYSQEQLVLKEARTVLQNLGVANMKSDYDKVKAIYDYICSNVTYATSISDTDMLPFSAYGALINKEAVCLGYANLFYLMAKEAGVNVRVITGESFGEGHAWNIVKLGDKYYCLDSTWDAGSFIYYYFLRGSEVFAADHINDSEYNQASFTNQHPISKSDFDLQEYIDNFVNLTPFTDVVNNDYFYKPVLWAVENGITTGMTATTFEPGAGCTRGQAVTFLWRAAGSPTPSGSYNPFYDVNSTDYFYNAVLWAVENGITTGMTATSFSPGTECTRGQIVTFQWRTAGMPQVNGNNPFYDVNSADYYHNAVLWAVANGITKGTSDNTFSPNDKCTRGQIVTFLYRDIVE